MSGGRSARLDSRTVDLAALTEVDVARWADLAGRALEPNPFVDPGYLLPALRWDGQGAGIKLVVVMDGEDWIAALPLSVMPPAWKLPLRLATTAGPFLSRRAPLCAPLVDRARAEPAIERLMEHLASPASGLPGLVELTLLPVGRLTELIRAECDRKRVRCLERYRFERACLVRSAGKSPRGSLSVRRRKLLARKERGLERSLGGPLELVDLGCDQAAVDLFLDLEASGWKGARGSALRRKPGAAAWFNEVSAGFAERGMLRILALQAGGETVYSAVQLLVGNTVFGMMDAYEERWSAFTPGVIGRVREQEEFMDRGSAELLDPCIHPRYVQPSALYPDRRLIVGLVLAPRGLINSQFLRLRPGMILVRDKYLKVAAAVSGWMRRG